MSNFWAHCTRADKAYFIFMLAWNLAAAVFFLCALLGVFS